MDLGIKSRQHKHQRPSFRYAVAKMASRGKKGNSDLILMVGYAIVLFSADNAFVRNLAQRD
jgi:hypothetical protein